MGYTHYWNNKTKSKPSKKRIAAFYEVFNEMLKEEESVISVKSQDDSVLHFNGIGEDEYECFVLTFDSKSDFDFCKTAEKPYDTLVVATLMLAEKMGIIKSWSSDGEKDDGDFDNAEKLLIEKLAIVS